MLLKCVALYRKVSNDVSTCNKNMMNLKKVRPIAGLLYWIGLDLTKYT